MTPIKYIGKRPFYTEGAYGSKIEFKKDETVLVPEEIAIKLLKHPDVYVEGVPDKGLKSAVIEKKEEEDNQEIIDSVALMDAKAVIEFVQNNFNIKLDGRKSVDTLRAEAIHHIDRFGIV